MPRHGMGRISLRAMRIAIGRALRSSGEITQRMVVIPYRRFGSTYRPRLPMFKELF